MKTGLFYVLCLLFGLAVGAAISCITLMLHPPEKRTGNVQPVQWGRTRDWTTTDSGTNYAIDFGFRADGVLIWRRGDKL